MVGGWTNPSETTHLKHTVDGRNLAPVTMVSISSFTGFYHHLRCLFGISSINSISQIWSFSPGKVPYILWPNCVWSRWSESEWDLDMIRRYVSDFQTCESTKFVGVVPYIFGTKGRVSFAWHIGTELEDQGFSYLSSDQNHWLTFHESSWLINRDIFLMVYLDNLHITG